MHKLPYIVTPPTVLKVIGLFEPKINLIRIQITRIKGTLFKESTCNSWIYFKYRIDFLMHFHFLSRVRAGIISKGFSA